MIYEYYKLQKNYEEFQALAQGPNYDTILKHLTKGRVSWKCNQNGQILFFPTKGMSYLGKQWNHFTETKSIPSGNISEVNKERALYLYAIMEDTKFDMGKAIEISIWINNVGKHNLRHPSLIFELCKKAGVLFTTLEERIVPPVEITIKSNQPQKEQSV